MQTDRKIVDVDDEIRPDDRPQEIPVITIEESPDFPGSMGISNHKIITRETDRVMRRIRNFTIFLLCVGLIGIIFWAYRFYVLIPEVESSVSDNDNINILKTIPKSHAKGTTVISDSVLGVAFDMYSLAGLKASLEREMPDTADKSLILFMRSADYHPDGSMLGNLVFDGLEMQSKERKNRAGYVAVSKNGVPVIGISFSDKVADYMKRNGGSFFRQYILLGDGELPSSFDLHGKVERAALARMADGSLFYVVTPHKETMYGFADALREYGFTDAIYLTGGNGYSFYRTTDGETHINAETKEKLKKYSHTTPPAPLLVFRNAE